MVPRHRRLSVGALRQRLVSRICASAGLPALLNKRKLRRGSITSIRPPGFRPRAGEEGAVLRLGLGGGFALALALGACGSGGGSIAPGGTPPPATFNTSGSTNSKPFTFVIQFDGTVSITQDGQTQTSVASTSSTSRFYEDVDANLPVSNLATTICAKSASFGTATTITYRGSTSGDISCSNSPAASQIWNDIQALESQFASTISTLSPAAQVIRPH